MKRTQLVILMAALTFGCAKRPDDIAPAYVSRSEYSGMSCAQLNQEAADLTARLGEVTGQQINAANNDAALTAVSIILFWPAAFFIPQGDKAEELGQLKGRALALEQAGNAQGCGKEPQIVEVPPGKAQEAVAAGYKQVILQPGTVVTPVK